MDPFHVVALAGDKLDHVRQRVQQQATGRLPSLSSVAIASLSLLPPPRDPSRPARPTLAPFSRHTTRNRPMTHRVLVVTAQDAE